jgi:hypothetical protein
VGALLVCTGFAGAQFGGSGSSSQNWEQRFEDICRRTAAQRLNTQGSTIQTRTGGVSNNRARIEWRIRKRVNGYCMINRDGNVVDFRQTNDWNGDNWSGGGGWNPGGGGGGSWDDDNWGGGGNIITPPRIRADTSGRGNYSDGSQSVRITRGWVDTTGQPSVALSGEDNFKITFRGDVRNQSGDREFTMRITGSDRGEARGRATFRLNKDRNEVEYINVTGRFQQRQFSGSFNR